MRRKFFGSKRCLLRKGLEKKAWLCKRKTQFRLSCPSLSTTMFVFSITANTMFISHFIIREKNKWINEATSKLCRRHHPATANHIAVWSVRSKEHTDVYANDKNRIYTESYFTVSNQLIVSIIQQLIVSTIFGTAISFSQVFIVYCDNDDFIILIMSFFIFLPLEFCFLEWVMIAFWSKWRSIRYQRIRLNLTLA